MYARHVDFGCKEKVHHQIKMGSGARMKSIAWRCWAQVSNYEGNHMKHEDWVVWEKVEGKWYRIATFHPDYFRARKLASEFIERVGGAEEGRVNFCLLLVGRKPKR